MELTTADAPEDIDPIGYLRLMLDGELADVVAAVEAAPNNDAHLDPYRYPDAREAAEYFEHAEQYGSTKVRVEHAGVEATIVGALGYAWRISADRPVIAGPTAQAVDVPDGIHITNDEGELLTVEIVGLYETHGVVYKRVATLLERISELGPTDSDPRVAAGEAIRKLRNRHAESQAEGDDTEVEA